MTRSALLLGTALAACLAVPAPAAAQAGAAPYAKAVRYDALRRATGTIAPDPDGTGPLRFAATRNSYDAAGNLVKVEKGELQDWQSEAVAPRDWPNFAVLQVVDTVYDALGRKTLEKMSGVASDETGPPLLQSATQYGYDISGRPTCTAVRMVPAAQLPADACVQGTPSAQFGPDRIVRQVHDAAGQLVQVREGVGTPVEAAEATFAYTPNGAKKYIVDANGNRAEYRYDRHGRLARWVLPSPTRPAEFDDSTPASALASAGAVNEADYEAYTLDLEGARIGLRNRAGEEIGYAYDALGRMTLKNRPGSEADIAYEYDLRGLQLAARFVGTTDAVESVYDKAGRLTSSTTNMAGTARTVATQYDRNGARTELKWPDAFAVAYDNDGLNRVIRIRSGTLELASFAYDRLGRRRTLTHANGASATYHYDGASRLKKLVHALAGTDGDQEVTLAYSPASQIASRSTTNEAFALTGLAAGTTPSTIDGLNRIATHNGVQFGYDAKGNLTSDGVRGFTYSSENLLTSMSHNGTYTLTYDPAMRLHRVAGWAGERMLYDGANLIGEYDASGALVRRYIHGPGVDEPLVWYEGSATPARRHLHADERGSIVAVSNDSGSLWNINRMDEYGVLAGASSQRFLYTGQAWVPELGLYYYKARFYAPRLGRFMQTDPIGYDDQYNLYLYAAGDPINYIDTNGQDSFFVARRLDSTVGKANLGHAFVVSHADRVGDPKARLHSFGELSNGNMGNVTNPARASDFSATTAAADWAAWRAMSPDSKNIAKIEARDDTVAAVAGAVEESGDYDMVPGFDLFGGAPAVNSNSAAKSVADFAERIASGNPKEELDMGNIKIALPGVFESSRVKFNLPKLCSSKGITCE